MLNPSTPSLPQLENEKTARYRNPILFADYSDPDAIRVGNDFWMTSSSFCNVPGLPILHSKDLINWELVNHALPHLVPEHHYSEHRAGCGVWAPAIRFHNGTFWIFYPDPDFGIYVTYTEDPRGQWSAPYLIKAGEGLIDPCPLWDGDKAYLIHGWAKSRSGICNRLTLHEMSLDATRLLDDGQVVIDGDRDTEWNTIEGPKLYKRDGWYWIFAPADGVATGCQTVFRSKEIFGPYEGRKVLEQGSTPINGPHQGAWVDTPEGEHWFLHFQENQPYGRVVHLQPMQWREDGWPVMGLDPQNTGIGEPVIDHEAPNLSQDSNYRVPQSDAFSKPELGRQWQWQANACSDWSTIDPERGTLRLNCMPRSPKESFWKTGPLLLQKVTGPQIDCAVDLQFCPQSEGDVAGFIVFGYNYFWIGLESTGTQVKLVMKQCLDANKKGIETVLSESQYPSSQLRLHFEMLPGNACQFSYLLNDGSVQPFGPEFQAKQSKWVGAKFGLFASCTSDDPSNGYATFKNLIVK
ncbi:glycoside hydrolase 43 family protein [Pelagicoccus enzymogenes]|uniref:glycoside hydrolase family 43 protein n=1 Tax=Pelagicoccus enzymogenes TaxID=2773457 RepID=UPI00280D6B08|nr:glycoside hydrolase 43 family protein [Pelagicoccus enzymogenes]MDQ8199967.1 glycoside hydrolase 43 family protein [Pelagicoccus enzymogenes]